MKTNEAPTPREVLLESQEVINKLRERAEKAEAKVVELRNAEVATFQYINHVLKSLPPEERPAVQRIIDGIKKAKKHEEQQ